MGRYRKVIFVCMDNTCRSIMAEAVMNSVNKQHMVEVESRGLVVLFPEPMNPKAVAILKNYQMKPSRESSLALQPSDVTEGTLVLTMTAYECRRKSSWDRRRKCIRSAILPVNRAILANPMAGRLRSTAPAMNILILWLRSQRK